MKNKKIFTLVFVIIFSFVLSVSTFASASYGQPVTLKDFFGNGVVSTSWFINDYYCACEYSWTTDNAIMFRDPVDGNPWPEEDVKNGVSCGVTYNLSPMGVSAGDRLLFNCNRLWFYPSGQSYGSGSYNLEFYFIFEDYNGLEHKVSAFKGAPISVANEIVAYSFTFDYTVPAQYKTLCGIDIKAYFYDNNFTDRRITMEAYNWEWYLGSADNAPIYSGADTSYLDDLKAQEKELLSQTSHGVSEVNGIFDNLNGILTPASDMGEGAIAVTGLLSPLFGMEPLDDILVISLAVGLIMFIIGTVTWIGGRSAKGSKVKGGKSK